MRQFSRRALLASAAAAGGAYLTSQVQDVGQLRSQLGNVRFESFSREPIFVAMLDRHAQRLQPLVPEIERALNRRLQIDALSTEQLYANYTIDLLQQTGRYDLVSLNDHWIPYFGRRGYLSGVDSIADSDSGVVYPPLVVDSATGVDDTPLVAYPWTIDFTCTAVRNDIAEAVAASDWPAMIRSIKGGGQIAPGMGLQLAGAGSEVYRSILLSYGEEILRESDGEPILSHYWQSRAMDVVASLARLAVATAPAESSLEQAVTVAESGLTNLLPVTWASDCRGLVDSGVWSLRSLPSGRQGRRRTFLVTWMWGIPAGAPNSDKAREFVELITNRDVQSRLWSGASLIPATRAALQSDDETWLPVRSLAFDALDRGRLRPPLRSYRLIMEIVGQAVAEVVTQDAPPARVLEAANRRVRDVLLREGELG